MDDVSRCRRNTCQLGPCTWHNSLQNVREIRRLSREASPRGSAGGSARAGEGVCGGRGLGRGRRHA